ncbi:MAG: ABC transporter substrate-binding protein [Chloroflexi bacterium]|nr:ABC transporter substrate-binding protein [Chloroflexota bacterium]
MNKKSKYLLASIIIIALLVPALWYFSMGRANAQQGYYGSGAVTITFWHAMQGTKENQLNELLRKFEMENPGIRVQAESVKMKPNVQGNPYHVLYNKILENLALRRPPNVAMVFENWTVGLIDVNAIVPVKEFLNQPGGITTDDINDLVPIFKEANTFNDVLTTMPFNKSIYVLFYNQPALDEAGFAPPKTWEELRDMSVKLTKTKPDGTIRYGIAFEPNVDTFGHYLITHDENFIDMKNNRVAFNNEVGLKDMQYWVDLIYKYKCAKMEQEAFDTFIKGDAVFYIYTTSRISTLEAKSPFPFGVALSPIDSSRKYQFGGTNLAIFRDHPTQETQASWKLVKYLTSKEVTTNWSINTGYLPVRKSAIESPKYQNFLNSHPANKKGIEALKYGKVQPKTPAWETIRGIVDDEMYNAAAKITTPEKALQSAAEKANLLLTKSLANGYEDHQTPPGKK